MTPIDVARTDRRTAGMAVRAAAIGPSGASAATSAAPAASWATYDFVAATATSSPARQSMTCSAAAASRDEASFAIATVVAPAGAAARIAAAAAPTSARPSSRNLATTDGIASISRRIAVGETAISPSAIREEPRQPASVGRENCVEERNREVRTAGDGVRRERLAGHGAVAADRRPDGQPLVALHAEAEVRLRRRER